MLEQTGQIQPGIPTGEILPDLGSSSSSGGGKQ
jgi:hypothetical protein